MTPAAGPWVALAKKMPEPGQSYLVWALNNGLAAMDVAFYKGRRPSGEHWWVLADINIDARTIVWWAALTSPLAPEEH